MNRFKVHVNVTDSTAFATFVLWHNDCCKLLMSTPEEILKKSPTTSPQEVFETLKGKQLLFKVQIKPNDLHMLYRNFSISKVCSDEEIIDKFTGDSIYNKVILNLNIMHLISYS